jgi:hypothetical protein
MLLLFINNAACFDILKSLGYFYANMTESQIYHQAGGMHSHPGMQDVVNVVQQRPSDQHNKYTVKPSVTKPVFPR